MAKHWQIAKKNLKKDFSREFNVSENGNYLKMSKTHH